MVEVKRSSVVDGEHGAGERTNGDVEEEFTAFFRQHYRGVVGLILLLGGSREEGEDAAQHAFADAYKKWRTLRTPSAWVRMAARNRFYKERSRDRGLKQRAIALHTMTRSDDEADQDLTAQWVDLNWIEQILAELPPAQRRILSYIFEGLSTKQIAELLGKNEPNVRSHLRHARNRLKERLAVAAPHLTPPPDHRAPDRPSPAPGKEATS
ncbi:RNA polymerase sigma factor [Actinomadura roseirufa]|uniref:RNA polymerase sigma factor n=1 Tax=Actinomadura roseirufa TaxID=2094049 RepID=UPI0013F157E4|nr:sigma-70 family RNA polymerase sigma factor [Actinomadura roseirufa]